MITSLISCVVSGNNSVKYMVNTSPTVMIFSAAKETEVRERTSMAKNDQRIFFMGRVYREGEKCQIFRTIPLSSTKKP